VQIESRIGENLVTIEFWSNKEFTARSDASSRPKKIARVAISAKMSERQYGVATAQTKLDCVQIDGLVVLKIIKHCRFHICCRFGGRQLQCS
jgi:hypothetical protein